MYNCFIYGYIAYRIYEYVGLLETVMSVGKGVKYVYTWIYPTIQQESSDNHHLDWVLVLEDENSPLVSKGNIDELP